MLRAKWDAIRTPTISHKAWSVVKVVGPPKKLTPEEIERYKHEERLDGNYEIAKFLGISENTFSNKYRKQMHEAGILFVRSAWKSRAPAARIQSKYFTYKRLVISWLMKRGGVL